MTLGHGSQLEGVRWPNFPLPFSLLGNGLSLYSFLREKWRKSLANFRTYRNAKPINPTGGAKRLIELRQSGNFCSGDLNHFIPTTARWVLTLISLPHLRQSQGKVIWDTLEFFTTLYKDPQERFRNLFKANWMSHFHSEFNAYLFTLFLSLEINMESFSG